MSTLRPIFASACAESKVVRVMPKSPKRYRRGQSACGLRSSGFDQGTDAVIEPTDPNSLKNSSRLMIDKVTTVPKTRLGKRLGELSDEDLVRLNRALTVFHGLAS
jgi:PemK-like, MazF-like toxin of type II toxin-antitoxin system